MEKYLIEVPHEATENACLNAVKVFMQSGSHFLVNADWGCYDDEHKAWMVVEVDSRDQAEMIVPPAFRKDAKVTLLTRFTRADMDEYSGSGNMHV